MDVSCFKLFYKEFYTMQKVEAFFVIKLTGVQPKVQDEDACVVFEREKSIGPLR
jgi:hypothetical protein